MQNYQNKKDETFLHLKQARNEKNNFLIFHPSHMLWLLKRTTTYVVVTQKNCLNETVLLSTQNIC